MGHEIIESGGGAAAHLTAPAAAPVTGAPAETELDDLEFEELIEAAHHASTDSPAAQRLSSYAARLHANPATRNTALRWLGTTVALMLLTGFVVHARVVQSRVHADAAALAVDVRVTQAPLLGNDRSPTDPRAHATVQLLLHNLGPRPVRLLGLTYLTGLGSPMSGTLMQTGFSVGSGEQLDHGFQVTLPCAAVQDEIGSPTSLLARLRTVDGTVHSEPVDLTALTDTGGIFQACQATDGGSFQGTADNPQDEPDVELSTKVVGHSVRMRLTIGFGRDTSRPRLQVSLLHDGVPRQVTFRTSPRLPTEAHLGSAFTVTLTPVVHGCPRRFDPDSLNGIGLTVGDSTYGDQNVEIVTALALGRACGQSQR